ncbi:MAG TPA: NERD domain-containing protein [Dongiaceae bacterium]|nr:NERD domain-containing protein [Dongiaceae bacterium]
MARFYPASFPEELKTGRNAAEYTVFEALLDELPDDYLVIHRLRWLAQPGQGRAFDGECDFLIAHPERGLLVLEVKGGHLGVDPATGRWTSRAATGEVHETRDPYEQATTAKHVLERKLKALPRWRGRHVPIGHAVVLPDCLKTGVGGPDGSPEITLDADDLNRPVEAIERAYGFWHLSVGEEWRRDGLGLIERAFVHRDFTRLRLGAQLGQFEREFTRLTGQQSGVLDLLGYQRRAAICGCAGSGKTMLAIEKARRLAGEGHRVLVTCYNKALADFIRSQLPPPRPTRPGARAAGAAVAPDPGQLDLFGHTRIEVEHFHALAAAWTRRAHVELPPVEVVGSERFFASRLPEALLEATSRLDERFDAILVDEGQDFLEPWWTPLQALLADPDDGILYVFYDDNQALYTGGAKLPIATPPYPLTRNCRNTQAIHRHVLRWYQGAETPTVLGPEGRPPETLTYRDEDALREHVRRTLHRLVHEEKVPERDIVVLTPRGRETSALWKDPQFGNLRLTDAWPPAPNHVQCATVWAFKGLERPVVVLTEIGASSGKLAELQYVGGSRAMSHLVVIEERGAEA